MIFRTVVAALLGAIALAAPAVADHSSLFNFGSTMRPHDCERTGGSYHCYGPLFGNPNGVEPGHQAFNLMTCSEARYRVQKRGFNKIKTERCRGRTFAFVALKNGKKFRVKVNAFTGRLKTNAL
jgi:hypothetical protein